MTDILALRGLTKRYGEKVVLNGIDFSVGRGEVVAVLGANGSGKTTLIKSILSLIHCEQGEIVFQGEHIGQSNRYLGNIGAVLEGSRNVHWRLSVEKNAQYFGTLRSADRASLKRRIDELIEAFDLEQYRHTVVSKLSTGNKQKVALLCAVVHDPDVILMDEPTLGLDIDIIDRMQKFILAQAREQGRTFLITSHDLEMIDKVCDRVVVIQSGVLVFEGGIDELKRNLHQFQAWIELSCAVPENMYNVISTLGEPNLSLNKVAENQLELRFNEVATGLRFASAVNEMADRVLHFESKKISIEQAYVELVDKEAQ